MATAPRLLLPLSGINVHSDEVAGMPRQSNPGCSNRRPLSSFEPSAISVSRFEEAGVGAATTTVLTVRTNRIRVAGPTRVVQQTDVVRHDAFAPALPGLFAAVGSDGSRRPEGMGSVCDDSVGLSEVGESVSSDFAGSPESGGSESASLQPDNAATTTRTVMVVAIPCPVDARLLSCCSPPLCISEVRSFISSLPISACR